MSIKLGTLPVAGIAQKTKTNAHSLFDFKWTDHILNEMSWLRGDTFSWQSGKIYVAAYNHLVADISSGTSKTETVGSYTISYVEAPDGHKITTDETTVVNIYNEIGTAWYYVLDITNQRFKLPRSSQYHGQLVKSYSSGTTWYRIYADGWCEQGGQTPKTTDATINVLFLVQFATENPNVQLTRRFYYDDDGSTSQNRTTGVSSVSSTGFKCYDNGWTSYGGSVGIWQASGYITNQLEQSHKHLYFYVGEFSQSATEQTAGLNASLFDGKVDLNAENLSSTGKSLIAGLAMPSQNYIVLTTGASGTSYTATTNGYFAVGGNFTQAGNYIQLTNGNMAVSTTPGTYGAAQGYIYMPAKKGDNVILYYYVDSILYFRFFPCDGDV